MDFRPSQVTGLIDISGTVDLSRLDVVAYDEASSVPDTTLTTVLTISPTVNTNISKISASGEYTAKWTLWLNAVKIGTLRASPGRDAVWDFSFPLAVDAGDTFDIKVEHFHVGALGVFEAGIYAFLSA